jgi:hypothetical protein
LHDELQLQGSHEEVVLGLEPMLEVEVTGGVHITGDLAQYRRSETATVGRRRSPTAEVQTTLTARAQGMQPSGTMTCVTLKAWEAKSVTRTLSPKAPWTAMLVIVVVMGQWRVWCQWWCGRGRGVMVVVGDGWGVKVGLTCAT